MQIQELFKTPIWVEEKSDFLTSLNKASDKYIKESKKREKKWIKKHGDFGRSYHSTPLLEDNNFIDFRNYVGQKSWDFLNWCGFDMQRYTTIFSEMWVQEFAKKGGGHHSAHIHWNQHVSGFYFLKCSEKTSYPIFHDPRPGAEMTKLFMKDPGKITLGSNQIHYKPKPGTMIVFPGYVPHQFAVDAGIEPFRFIHWNIKVVETAISKERSNNNELPKK